MAGTFPIRHGLRRMVSTDLPRKNLGRHAKECGSFTRAKLPKLDGARIIVQRYLPIYQSDHDNGLEWTDVGRGNFHYVLQIVTDACQRKGGQQK